MTAYYNEFDPFAAQWLRNLIDAGHIAPGVVDDRSIIDVTASDLSGFTQCHFFAGIGGWSLALRLAGVPDSFPCWTGSPPCQPFSVAGKQLGQLDERHLAPTFMRLVAQCRPTVLFGEQVAAAIGKHWLDDLFTELEAEGYACAAAVLPACSVGAPHKRDRLFFGASFLDHASSIGQFARGIRHNGEHDGEQSSATGENGGMAQPACSKRNCQRLHGLRENNQAKRSWTTAESAGCGGSGCMADTDSERLQGQRQDGDSQGREGSHVRQTGLCDRAGACTLAHCDNDRQQSGIGSGRGQISGKEGDNPRRCESTGKLGDANRSDEDPLSKVHSEPRTCAPRNALRTGAHHGFWSYADWLSCRDGKFRPVEPGTFPLVNGISRSVGRGKSSSPALAGRNRVGRLRGYGNAIVPQVAAEFIRATLDAAQDGSNA